MSVHAYWQYTLDTVSHQSCWCDNVECAVLNIRPWGDSKCLWALYALRWVDGLISTVECLEPGLVGELYAGLIRSVVLVFGYCSLVGVAIKEVVSVATPVV
jgi:hypothetical protein